MNRYSVELTDAALSAISAHARYIAEEAQAPLNAQRWLERIWDAVDSLEHWPMRASLAEESSYVGVEVRQLIIGKHLLLFTVDEPRRTIWIVGCRHGHRRPRPDEIPPGADAPGLPDPES